LGQIFTDLSYLLVYSPGDLFGIHYFDLLELRLHRLEIELAGDHNSVNFPFSWAEES
jgi:hypothetical protein